jgi:hypothetical protein
VDNASRDGSAALRGTPTAEPAFRTRIVLLLGGASVIVGSAVAIGIVVWANHRPTVLPVPPGWPAIEIQRAFGEDRCTVVVTDRTGAHPVHVPYCPDPELRQAGIRRELVLGDLRVDVDAHVVRRSPR